MEVYMQIRRFGDIVAIQDDTIASGSAGIVAFHASNLEIAEISLEAFNCMPTVEIAEDMAPSISLSGRLESDEFTALQEWLDFANPNVKSGKMEVGVRTITLNVNQICNLKCNYCAASGDGTYGAPTTQIDLKQTFPQIEFFIQKTPIGGKFAISFIGGEPLLHPFAVKAIYDYTSALAKQRDISMVFKIVTNGTLINDVTIKILKQMNVDLTISMDGRSEINDIVRPSKDGSSPTKKILTGLGLLHEDRGLIRSIHISAVTTQQNCDLFENFLFIYNLPVDTFDFVFANDEKDPLTQSKYISDYKKIMAYLWNKGGERELTRLKSIKGLFSSFDNQQRTENFCGAGKNYLMIDAKNRLYNCVWDANDTKNMIGQGTTIQQSEVSNLSKSLVDLNNCTTCWARFVCGGGCMHINKSHSGGNKHQKSKMFCERTRSLLLSALLYYKLSRTCSA